MQWARWPTVGALKLVLHSALRELRPLRVGGRFRKAVHVFLIDSHLDLGLNALHWNRDLKRDVADVRASEEGMTEKGRQGSTVTLRAMRQGQVGIACCTLLARVARPDSPATGYRDHDIAFAFAQGELAYYRQLEREGEVRLLYTWQDVQRCAQGWLEGTADAQIGLLITMEGADPIVQPSQLEFWWRDGLRILSLVHYGVSQYAHGTGTEGPLWPAGRALLAEMERLGLVLDVTHLSEPGFYEALDLFGGPVMASHNNCRQLCPGDRQFTYEQLDAILKRGGVIGVALDAWMLYPGWVRGETRREDTGLTLDAVADNMDTICQRAGNARQVGIGSDLDGGFGVEQVPKDLDTIVDLQKLIAVLQRRGYTEADTRAIFHGNWMDYWQRALPSG